MADNLNAELDEDEAAAKKAAHGGDGRWRVSPGDGSWGDDMIMTAAMSPGCDIGDDMANCGPLQSAHIARHDPARVLREVEAKRRILAWHSGLDADYDYGSFPHDVIAALTSVYSDHDDCPPGVTA